MPIPEHLANRDHDVAAVLPASDLPAQGRIVIVGGGIVGSSIAYHLVANGERDVVLLERGRLTNGTTWHAAGLVSQVRGTHALTALTAGNAATYERIGAETGIDTGIRLVTADARTAHKQLSELGLEVSELLDWDTAPLMFSFCDHDGNRLYVSQAD